MLHWERRDSLLLYYYSGALYSPPFFFSSLFLASFSIHFVFFEDEEVEEGPRGGAAKRLQLGCCQLRLVLCISDRPLFFPCACVSSTSHRLVFLLFRLDTCSDFPAPFIFFLRTILVCRSASLSLSIDLPQSR